MSNGSRANFKSVLRTTLLFGVFAFVVPFFSRLLPNSMQNFAVSKDITETPTMDYSPAGTSESATTMLSGQPTSMPMTSQPLLSPANILSFLKGLYAISLYILASLLSTGRFIVISVPKFASLPFIHGTRLTFTSVRLAMRPVLPILAPLSFASKIVLFVLLGPLGVLYAFGGVMYPVYVFLGAAVVVGAVVGLFMRMLARVLLEDVLGVRLVGRGDEDYRPSQKRIEEKIVQIKQEDAKGKRKLADRKRVYW